MGSFEDKLLCKKAWTHIYNELTEIYMSVFKWENLPDSIDGRYIERSLMHHNQVAFYLDDLIEQYVCLQSATVGKPDVYGNPVKSRVYGVNGYSKYLKPDTHVVMFDNLNRKTPIYRLMQFAQRIWNMERTIDVNISQQKTPRIIKASKDTELSIKTMLRDVDNYKERVVTVDGFNENAVVDMVLAPAPFISDKVRIEKQEIWNEVLSFIGVENKGTNKAERVLADELKVANALAIVKRNSRLEARRQAVTRINKKYNLNVEVEVNQESLVGSLIQDLHERGLEDGEIHNRTKNDN